MATQGTVNGAVIFADGSVPKSATMRFVLSTWDSELNEVVTPGGETVSVDVNTSTGAWTASLWANETGRYNTVYSVSLTEYFDGDEYTGSRSVTRDMGVISVPGDGVYNFNNLSFNPAVLKDAEFSYTTKTGDSINFAAVLMERSGIRMNLTGVAVAARMKHPDGTTFQFSTVKVDEAIGRVDLDLAADETNNAPLGSYAFEVLTKSGTREARTMSATIHLIERVNP